MDDETLRKYAYVISSTYRVRVVKSLKGSVKIPSGIASEWSIRTNHISKVLTELKNEGIVVCLNEDARKGRLYRLTPVGEKIAKGLEENNS